MSILTKLFGDANIREIKRLQPIVDRINELEKHYEGMSDDHLREQTANFRAQLKEDPKKDEALLPDVFALVREAAKRTLKMRHYDVQLMGGMILHSGKISEMRTGEGKTLVASLPLFLNALKGKGVHLVTVNDYLAKRDAVWMGQVYHFLGLSVASIQHEEAFLLEPTDAPLDEVAKHLKPISRKEAYNADITYGTNNEFGFDYLRDNMVTDPEQKVQRGHHYAIVDEVDSILIDEARTPLIISAPSEQPAARYYQFADLVAKLEPGKDYNVDEKMRSATLTDNGITRIEQMLGVKNIYEEEGVETVHHLEQALKARTLFQKDKEYVVKDGEIIIVDEFTGRLMFGRRYSEGLHQAIEAKERVDIKEESVTLATITFQNYFRLYEKLAGMTGTAATEAEEFAKIYNLETLVVPTNKPMVRADSADKVYKTETAKFAAIIQTVKEMHKAGQPVLLGTISIEKNELLSQLLHDAHIPHEMLNAKNHEREAKIVAQAGRKHAVTLATNIAGRGVDIILGGNPPVYEEGEEVKALGGLAVIGTERHESRRIDNQLRGRAGRQGDPGMSMFFVSLEDDLMRVFGSDRMKTMMDRLGLPDDMPIENGMVSKAIESAQRRVEGHNFDIRKHLVEYDDVMNKHREVIYRRRDAILATVPEQKRLRPDIEAMLEREIERIVTFHTGGEDEASWNIDEVYEVISTIFPINIHDRLRLEDFRGDGGDKLHDVQARDAMVKHLISLGTKAYDVLEQQVNDPAVIAQIERGLSLRSIDTLWIEHIDHMDHLRRGIGLRGYGQRDPLVEYKKEAYDLFQRLSDSIDSQIVYSIFKVSGAKSVQDRGLLTGRQVLQAPSDVPVSFTGIPQTASDIPQQPQEEVVQTAVAARPKDEAGHKISRNDPCFCGSGKKYKKCGELNTAEHQQLAAKMGK